MRVVLQKNMLDMGLMEIGLQFGPNNGLILRMGNLDFIIYVKTERHANSKLEFLGQRKFHHQTENRDRLELV